MKQIIAPCNYLNNKNIIELIQKDVARRYDSSMSNDIDEIRYKNLATLIERHGGAAYGRKKRFADKCNMNPAYVSQLTNKVRNIGKQVAREIEKALGLEKGWMDQHHYAAHSTDKPTQKSIREPEPAQEYNAQILPQTNQIPVVDMVAAGDWTETTDPYPVGDAESWELCPVPHGENTFAVRISGESMLPKFEDGEIVFCDPSRQPENKDYVIAKLTDENQATFKQLVIEGGQKMLKALNPGWPTKYVSINGNCHIVGKVIARLEKF